MLRLIALGPSLILCASTAEARSITFTGGVLSGLTAEVPDDGRPASAGYFKPGVSDATPTSPERAKGIAAVLASTKAEYDQERPQKSYPEYVGKRAPDEDWSHFGGRLQAQCKIEQPVHLSDDRERIGVVCGDRIVQFFVISFAGNEIAKFELDEAIVPNLLPERG